MSKRCATTNPLQTNKGNTYYNFSTEENDTHQYISTLSGNLLLQKHFQNFTLQFRVYKVNWYKNVKALVIKPNKALNMFSTGIKCLMYKTMSSNFLQYIFKWGSTLKNTMNSLNIAQINIATHIYLTFVPHKLRCILCAFNYQTHVLSHSFFNQPHQTERKKRFVFTCLVSG